MSFSLCELSGGCRWFPFRLWTGKRWVDARQCLRTSCGCEQWQKDGQWIGANLRYVWEA